MRAPGTYLDFPAAWTHFVTAIPPEDRGDVVGGLAKIFAVQPQNEAERERVLKAASACVAWESSASRLNRDESSQSQPDQRYALMAARISIHYMINGGFLGAGSEANRDNNYILDHLTVDIELTAQPQDVIDQMCGRVVGECRRGIVVACGGCAFATAALVKKNDPVSRWVEKVGMKLVASCARSAVQEHHRLAVFSTVFFPINPVKRVLLDSLITRFTAE
jgi:hypothetical protein